MEGQRTKNLFLKEEKGDRIFLVAVPDFKKVDLNKLRYILKSERLTFGKPELLLKYLGVEPGSVTIFGVSNDIEQKVELYIDQIIIGAELIQAHPLRNTASLVITPQELLKFLREIGRREATVVDVPSKE